MAHNNEVPSDSLLSFSAENVRSFRDELEFSLLATAMQDPTVVRQLSWREGGKPIGVLPVAGVFGANASGKSNFLHAMQDMRVCVLQSFRGVSPNSGPPRLPFKLDSDHAVRPSRYEVDLVLGGIRHQYGFVVDDERVLEEWAIRYPKGRAVSLFERDGDATTLGTADRAAGRAVLSILRPNALFLSTAAATDHPGLAPLYDWFEQRLLLAEAESRFARQALTSQMLDDPDTRERILELLRVADLGVVDVQRRRMNPEMRQRMEKAVRVLMGDEESDGHSVSIDELDTQLVHRGTTGPVAMAPNEESLGTQVWLGLVGPVVVALRDGATLLADELDASLHPVLVHEIVRLFQQPHTNPRNAQLIFNAHDMTLLGDSADRLLGRDQIWLTEKLETGASRLYALADLDPRKDEAIGRRYLAGRYGGVPIVAPDEFDRAAALVTAGEDR